MLFKIDFEVDNGAAYTRDVALVMANDSEEAVRKLRQLINSINSETCVSEIFKINVFNGSVFTGRHGYK